MEDLAPRPTEPTDSSQIANLKREDARIRLQWANFASRGLVVVLFAPSIAGNEQLLKAAVHELGVSLKFVDTTSFFDMSGLAEPLKDATSLVVFDDPEFRDAPYSLHQLVIARRKRRDLHPLVVRVGTPTDEDDDIEAHLATGECMPIQHLEEWRQVPVFLMEMIYKQAMRRRAGG